MVEAGGIEPPSASDPRSGATFLVSVLSVNRQLPKTKSGDPSPKFYLSRGPSESNLNRDR